LGIDLAPSIIELAKIGNPQADFMVIDCRPINKLNKELDAIVCGFCMPYLSKKRCGKMINNFSKLLRPPRLLYFCTQEGNYDKLDFETTRFSGRDNVFIYYHQEVF
jgi:chemotaxis methyl-accepting protein methylase